jgi:hypothetical protein
MKISAKEFPFLNKNIKDFYLEDKDVNEYALVCLDDYFIDKYTKCLFFTKPFVNAAFENRAKLLHLLSELKPGKFLLTSSEGSALCVYIRIIKDLVSFEVVEIDGEMIINYCDFVVDKGIKKDIFKLVSPLGISEESETHLEIESGGVVYNIGCFLSLIFYQFADVEILLLNAQKKRGHLSNCKYVSEANSEIEIVDCSWFRTLVNSEGFKVRGHFAIRAFGEGRSSRRLVWISEYEKQGYERKAGILK